MLKRYDLRSTVHSDYDQVCLKERFFTSIFLGRNNVTFLTLITMISIIKVQDASICYTDGISGYINHCNALTNMQMPDTGCLEIFYIEFPANLKVCISTFQNIQISKKIGVPEIRKFGFSDIRTSEFRTSDADVTILYLCAFLQFPCLLVFHATSLCVFMCALI